MATKSLQRRHFLKQATSVACGALKLGAVSPVLSLIACSNNDRSGLLLSAAKNRNGAFTLCAVKTNGDIHWKHDINVRGHDVAINPQGTLAAFVARRPGKAIWLIETQSGQLQHQLELPSRSQFNGHATFSADGQRLFTSETAYPNNIGSIGVYDVASGKRIATLSSGGVDPHQCELDPATGYLVIANGGRIEDEHDRKKRSVDPRRPSNVSWLNTNNGEIIAQHTLNQTGLSLRHFDISAAGVVVVGCQTDNRENNQALLYRMSATSKPIALQASSATWQRYKGYVASVSIMQSGSSSTLVATSPKGNVWARWHLTSGQLIEQNRLRDVSGVCHTRHNFILTTGRGELFSSTQTPVRFDALAFDNHCRYITAV